MDCQIRVLLADIESESLEEIVGAISDLLVERGFHNREAIRSVVPYGPYEWPSDRAKGAEEYLEDAWGMFIPGATDPADDADD